ncbi:Yip1 family protein [Crateriforma conspicua]|uniref:Yip1 family protein n=1 Tax=Crateriforma conspicua TaxID=2527996 RepID=UPI0011878F56|nr:Yip1 family protein [Crateriforma conspicua]QDV61650.1 Yip1 domain protein [Crateriforma conspicua]
MRSDDPASNPYATPSPLSVESGENVSFVGTDDDLRPFRTIWTSPRRTVRQIVSINPKLHVVLLACLAGVGETLDRASTRNAGDDLPLAAILGIAILIGPLAGLFSLWIGSHLVRFSGSWIGGVASREHIKTAIAWASVPSIAALPLWIPQIVLFGSDLFTQETPGLEAQPMLLIPFLAFALVELVLGVWAFVLLCNTIAEVQGFRSAWRGFGNLILAGAVVVVPLLGLVLVVAMLSNA